MTSCSDAGESAVVRLHANWSVHVVPIRVAESIMYACNRFHMLEVAFTNQFTRLYQLLGVDARHVMDVVRDHNLNISSAYVRHQVTPRLIQRLSEIDDLAPAEYLSWSPSHQGGACTERPD